jgi:hypothetical protein
MVSECTRLFVKIVRLRKFLCPVRRGENFNWSQAMWGLHAAAKTWLFQCCYVSPRTIKVNIGSELAWTICTDSLRKSQKNGLLIMYQIKIRTISQAMEGGRGVPQ